MRWLCLVFALVASSLTAQTIDRDRSGWATDGHGRFGCFAPFRVSFDSPVNAEAVIESVQRSVVVTRRIVVRERPAVIDIPAQIHSETRIRVTVGGVTDEWQIPMPESNVPADYENLYVAVFASDVAGARERLGRVRGVTLDVYDVTRLFDDWRYLDGYDALVVLGAGQLSERQTTMLRDFLSLGGSVIEVGERFVPESRPEELSLSGAKVKRFPLATGGYYRVTDNDWNASSSVIARCAQDQSWFGAAEPPGGEPFTRGASFKRLPDYFKPLPASEVPTSGAFWFGMMLLGFLLVMLALVFPRLVRRSWWAYLAMGGASCSVLVVVAFMPRVRPNAEVLVLWRGDADGPTSARMLVSVEAAHGEEWVVDLDRGDRALARTVLDWDDRKLWTLDVPMASGQETIGETYELRQSRVGELTFRDFGTSARNQETALSLDAARLVDWWLDANAWRGRKADFGECENAPEVAQLSDANVTFRAGVWVKNLRHTPK